MWRPMVRLGLLVVALTLVFALGWCSGALARGFLLGIGGSGCSGIGPTPCAGGPSSGLINVASTSFTVTLSGATFSGAQTVTIADGQAGASRGTFVPSVGTCATPGTCTVTPANAATFFTFTYTPTILGPISLTITNAQTWTNPPVITYISLNSYTASGPSSGIVGLASTNFTVNLVFGTFSGTQTIAIGDGGKGGLFTPSVGSPGTSAVTVTPTAGATSFTFTYTPAIVGPLTLSFGNGQGWPNPASLPYTSNNNSLAASGPSSGLFGVPSTNFTVTLANGTFNGTQTVSISDGGLGGVITPSVGSAGMSAVTVTPTTGTTNFTFTYTPVRFSPAVLAFTNGQGWNNPASLTYNATDTYTVSGPSGGTVNVASSAFTVTLAAGTFTGSQTIAISDGGQGGTFTPSIGSPAVSNITVTPLSGTTGFTFTYTPIVVSTLTLTFTNGQGWTDQTPLTYASAGGGVCLTGVIDLSTGCANAIAVGIFR